MVAQGSISLIIFSCTEEPKEISPEVQIVAPKVQPDLSDAIQKRVENKPEEAVILLRKYNKEFPDSPKILIQLSRALSENGEHSLAAFRIEQAISAGAEKDLLLECAKIYQLSGDLDSAQERFKQYLTIFPEDLKALLTFARSLVQNGNETKALNAFEKADTLLNPEDCHLVAVIYLKKKIYVKAEHWFRESAQREKEPTVAPLLGLLRVEFENGNESATEELILAIEKSYPGALNEVFQSQNYRSFIIERRLAEFQERGIIIQDLSTSELVQELLRKKTKIVPPVVSSGPKSSPLLSDSSSNSTENINSEESITEIITELTQETSLAEAFAPTNIELIEPSPLELGWSAFLSGNYRTALVHARDAIKEKNSDSEAWRLSSQVHFQLGEIREAEMTILEAIRHNPKDLKTRMDYLSIARETLPSSRYLGELEKTHERFPDSGEILWQLARRYHNVERMPVTAGILYRKLLTITPEGGGLHTQAKMELIKIKNL